MWLTKTITVLSKTQIRLVLTLLEICDQWNSTSISGFTKLPQNIQRPTNVSEFSGASSNELLEMMTRTNH